MIDKSQLLDAIWEDPARVTGLQFSRRGRCWQTSQRPDGTQTQRPDKLVLRRVDSGQIFANYNGDTYTSGDIWTLLAQIHNETFAESILRAGDAYGITDNDPKAAERVAAVRQRQTEYAQAQICLQVLKGVKGDDLDIARDYVTKDRGLQWGKEFVPFGVTSKSQCRNALINSGVERQAATDAINRLFPTLHQDWATGRGMWRDYADHYSLAIPYINGNRVIGFCLRLTGVEDAPSSYTDKDGRLIQLPKYLYSRDMPKGGYCGQLTGKQPCYMVEGLLDAIALRQAGVGNVLALGGMTPTVNEDEGKSQISTLERWGISHMVYIPDLEYDANGDAKTDATARTVKAIVPLLSGSVKGFKSLKIATLPNPKGRDKVDACSAIVELGADAVIHALKGADDWWQWSLRRAAGLQDADDIAAAAADIYNAIDNPMTRERVRNLLSNGNEPYIAALKSAGVSALSLSEIDRTGKVSSYRQGIAEVAGRLSAAVDKRAKADTIGKILTDANRLQRAGGLSAYTAQLNAGRDAFVHAVQSKRPYLTTSWALYKMGKDRYRQVRNIGFAPESITVIGAPTSHGKTLFMLSAALQLVKNYNKHILYISFENSFEQLIIRALASYIGGKLGTDWQPQGNIRTTIREYIKGNAAPRLFADGPAGVDMAAELDAYWTEIAPWLHCIAAPDNGAETLCQFVASTVEQYAAAGQEVAAVFVDYVQLLHLSGRSYSRTDEIKTICDTLNACAKQTGVALVCGSQMNRESTRTNGVGLDGITLGNLGESSGIENIAEDCYMIYSTDRVNVSDYYVTKGKGDKAQVFELSPSQRRARRIFTSVQDANSLISEYTETDLRAGCLYIESLKAREYAIGCHCLLPVSFATGGVADLSQF